MVANRPRGREAQYVHDRKGKKIVGLSCNASDGRFYATHSKPRKWFGADFDVALIRFYEWEARQNGETVEIVDTHVVGRDDRPKFRRKGNTDEYERVIKIGSDAWWQTVGSEIRKDPVLAAAKTGLPLDRLHQYKPLPPSPLLADIGQMYYDKSGVSGEWQYKSKRFWDEFVKIVAVDTVRKLDQPRITAYYDHVTENATSDTYAKHRFGAVKRVLNFAAQRGECDGKPIDNGELITILAYCKVFENFKANGNKEKPNPITVDNFHKLLNAADDAMRGILYCGLNFCMYLSEICNLEWSDIDLDKGTLVTQRSKTGKQLRVAVLWDRTIKALRKIKRTNSPYIFNSIYGTQYDPEGLRTAFRKLRKDDADDTDINKVDASVKFNNLRDGGIQACIDAGADVTQYRLVSGHSLGGRDDDYYVRNPRKVAPACEAIEKHYFPPTPTKKGGKK